MFTPSFGNLLCERTLMFTYGSSFIKWYIISPSERLEQPTTQQNLPIVANAPTTLAQYPTTGEAGNTSELWYKS